MAKESFNPYGSAISRTGLFVYDPNKALSEFIEKGEKGFQEGFEKVKAKKQQEILYAKDTLDNIGELLDQADVLHTETVNGEVDELLDWTRETMFTTNKRGKIKLNLNDPTFRSELRQRMRKVKNGINNSKLLAAEYQKTIDYANTNKDVLSDITGLINRASSMVSDNNLLFSSNSISQKFQDLRNESVDGVKSLELLINDDLNTQPKSKVQYNLDVKDSEGKDTSLIVQGDLTTALYEFDADTGLPVKGADGRPILNEDGVKELKKRILEKASSNDKIVELLDGSPENEKLFRQMISNDLILQEQSQVDRERAETEELRQEKLKQDIDEGDIEKIEESYSITPISQKVGDVNKDASIYQFEESRYQTDQVIKGQNIQSIRGIGKSGRNKVVFIIGAGGKEMVLHAGMTLGEVVGTEGLGDEQKLEVITQAEIDKLWDSANNDQKGGISKTEKVVYEKTILEIDQKESTLDYSGK